MNKEHSKIRFACVPFSSNLDDDNSYGTAGNIVLRHYISQVMSSILTLRVHMASNTKWMVQYKMLDVKRSRTTTVVAIPSIVHPSRAICGC